MADQTIEVSVDENAGSLTEYFPAHADRYGPGTTQIYSVDGSAVNGSEYTFAPTSGYDSGGHGHLEIKYPATVQINPNTFSAGSKDFDLIGVAPNGFTLDYHVTINPIEYHLQFTFKQEEDSSKHIQSGVLTALITCSDGTTQTMSTTATTDDALPLSSGTSPITAKISKNFSGGGLVFDLSGLASNSSQTSVELHGGQVPDYGQISGDSQSCVVADSGFMPLLLKTLTQDYRNSTGGSSSSPTDVAAWINDSCSPTMTSSDSLSQALLNVQNAPKQRGLLFSISRAIEKRVKVLFAVTDQKTGDTTTREAFIQPNKGSTLISYGSLFHSGSDAGVGDKFLTNPQGNENYQASFNQALSSSDHGDPLEVSIHAYQILYHGGSTTGHTDSGYNPWYFDTKPGNSGTNVSGESLMFGSKTTTNFHI